MPKGSAGLPRRDFVPPRNDNKRGAGIHFHDDKCGAGIHFHDNKRGAGVHFHDNERGARNLPAPTLSDLCASVVNSDQAF